MHTQYLTVNEHNPEEHLIAQAAALLKAGEVVAFPTETVYGLGANALNAEAVRKIFRAKGRPSDNPLIVHVSAPEEINPLVRDIPPQARVLMDKFWPGPLTLVLPKSDIVPLEVTAGLDTVAVRMPEHQVALALIRRAEVPVAAPSANISGKPSPTAGKHVWEDLQGKIALVLDGGEARVGVESTVLDVTQTPPIILRPGGITWEEIAAVVGEVEVDVFNCLDQAPRSPGMKYRHYAPDAEVFIVGGDIKERKQKISAHLHTLIQQGKRVAILVSEETASHMKVSAAYLEILGSQSNLAQVARNLFSALRRVDETGVDIVLIEEFPHQGIGSAIMNRVGKAAGNRYL